MFQASLATVCFLHLKLGIRRCRDELGCGKSVISGFLNFKIIVPTIHAVELCTNYYTILDKKLHLVQSIHIDRLKFIHKFHL